MTTFDVVVVGSGAAGLSAALRAAELNARVGVFTAGALLAGSSPRAQGGVAAAVGADDAPAMHAADTLAVGAGLNDLAAVDVLTFEGSRSVQQLLDDGVPFEDNLGLEAGHTRRRILHAGGGATGKMLTSALLQRALDHPRIRLFDYSPVLAVEVRCGAVSGVRVGHGVVRADAVILATGGYAALWGRTTNAAESRGSGLSLAWHAGASLADLEFVQFHPTVLSVPGRPAFLLSEALRGEGARLVDDEGTEVVDPLLPRDVVARALQRVLRQGRRVFLSLQHLDAGRIHAQFGGLSATLREAFDGLDLARDLLPVAPAAHYCMGGVRTDTWGRTDVPGLYAAGEVACSGAQGANRLASNSLLECLVFGARAAEAALSDPAGTAAAWRTTPLARAQGSVGRLAPCASGVGQASPSATHSNGSPSAHDTAGPVPKQWPHAAGDTSPHWHFGARRGEWSNAAGDPLAFGDPASGRAQAPGARGAASRYSDSELGRAQWPDAEGGSRESERLRLEALDAAVLGARLDQDLGVERDGDSLARLIAELPGPSAERPGACAELAGLGGSGLDELLLVSLIARAAWLRAESRGAHFRSDAPEADPAWRGRIHWRRAHLPTFEEVLA